MSGRLGWRSEVAQGKRVLFYSAGFTKLGMSQSWSLNAAGGASKFLTTLGLLVYVNSVVVLKLVNVLLSSVESVERGWPDILVG